jgi:signal peptidase
MKKVVFIIAKVLLYTLYFVVIVLGLAVAILLACGMKLYCVETGSMEPEYPIGSMVVVERVWFDQLSVGDVITYVVSDNTVVTHRLVGIDTEHRLLTTKGDNSNVADASPVNYENVIGRVNFCIPGFGYVFLLLSTRFGKIMLGILAVALIGFYILRRMYYKSLEEEEEKAQSEPDSESEEDSQGEAKALLEQKDKADGDGSVEQKEDLKEERSGTL